MQLSFSQRVAQSKKPYTVNQVAELFGKHIMTIYKWVREGKIPFLRIGRDITFDPIVLSAWVEKREFLTDPVR
jgi:excisionase family DNA binding protein